MTQSPTPAGNQRRKSVWQEASRRLLQAEMKLHGYTYKSLARVMGEDESDQALMTRVNRGTFSLAFFLEALRVMGVESVDISHLKVPKKESSARAGARTGRQ